MATVNNNSSTTGATSYTSKGFSGLVSGMDTEELVEAMTSDVQAKIDKVKKQQQTYTWKQEAYREVITSLTDFQSKYLSYTSSTNLLSSSFYNTTAMTPGGTNASAISVSGNSTTTTPAYSITGISSLASKATMTSGGTLSRSDITTGTISFEDKTVCAAAGGSIAIKYGSSVYEVSIGEDVTALNAADMATALNTAMESVTLSSGATLADKLAFSSTGETLALAYTGTDTNSFSISGGTTATLTALGFSVGNTPTDGTITAANPVALEATAAFSLAGKSLTFDLDGISKTIEFTNDDTDDARNITDLENLIRTKIDKAFGSGKITVSSVDSKLTFKVASDTVDTSTSVLKITSATSNTLGTTGIFNLESGASNRLDTTKKLSELGLTAGTDGNYTINVNGKSLIFDPDTEIGSVISQINNSAEAAVDVKYLKTTGRFSITADDSGAQGKINIYDEQGGDLAKALFGENALYNTGDNTESDDITAGKDLEMSIRYTGSTTDTNITRSTNGVTIDGLSFTAKTEFDATTTADEITFTSSSEPTKVLDAIKSLVTDYNKIIDMVTSYTETKKDTRYKPLTDAQKKEMKTDEIEKWEAKAKEGILFGDSTLSSLASSMRFVFSTAISNVGTAASIGITTSSIYSDNGKLKLDENKLKTALASDPDKVKSIFTATAEQSASVTKNGYLAGGLATRVKTIMEDYAKTTGSNKGKLVELAGLKNSTTTTDNYIARQQKVLTNKLDYLEDLLETRQDRYQKKFTKLETYISKMNAQSSWLSSSTS